MVNLTAITNFLQINPCLGTAGMPTADQIQLIANCGYEVVINLALDQSPGAIPDEQAIVTTLGMEYIHIPIVWEHPHASDLDHFFAAMQKWSGHKIFVHCVLNMRVAVFVYLYRVISLQEKTITALQDLSKIWQPDPIWQAFMDTTLKKNY